MTDGAPQGPRRYSAFICYSQADARLVRRFHRKLEAYRLPTRLRGAAVSSTGRLKPLFRDDDDLSAAPDLTKAIRDALADSDFLIVFCSPHAAASQWVTREIELFRHLHGEGRILTALLAGEPETAFPAALRRHRKGHEPLAADLRPDIGSGRLALLKLVASLASVHLDDLVHRDGQRRTRQVMVGFTGALAATGVVATLAVVALNARTEASIQAKRANGLGDFMTSDLRAGLEAAGRHDLLKAVNRAVLRASEAEDISRMTPGQRAQRAVVLQNIAKDAEKAGDLMTARAKVDEAYKITAALLTARNDDQKWIFAHAQSEYWVGLIGLREGDAAAARAGFEAYARLADRLVAADRANDDWRMEQVYASNNLGMLALRQTGDAAHAEGYFRAALGALKPILQHKPGDAGVLILQQTNLAWLADSLRLQGRLSEAAKAREEQARVLEGMLALDPRNVEVRRQLLFHDLAVARIAAAQGDRTRALTLLKDGQGVALALASADPDNKDFPRQARMFQLFEIRLWLDQSSGTHLPPSHISTLLGDCAPLGPGADNREISDFCSVLLARLYRMRGDIVGEEAALVPVRKHLAKQHAVLTARWGLDLAAEARPVQLAEGDKR